MTNSKKLRKAIKDSGMSIIFIAMKCDMSRQTLYNRINGRSEFTAKEIELLSDVLRLSKQQIAEIFFE